MQKTYLCRQSCVRNFTDYTQAFDKVVSIVQGLKHLPKKLILNVIRKNGAENDKECSCRTSKGEYER